MRTICIDKLDHQDQPDHPGNPDHHGPPGPPVLLKNDKQPPKNDGAPPDKFSILLAICLTKTKSTRTSSLSAWLSSQTGGPLCPCSRKCPCPSWPPHQALPYSSRTSPLRCILQELRKLTYIGPSCLSCLGLWNRILESPIKVGCPSHFKSFYPIFLTVRKPLLLWSF